MPTTSSESPPKRMTRARARAVEDKTSTAKTTKITTPAAKAAASARTAAKRKIRADEDETVEPSGSTGKEPEKNSSGRVASQAATKRATTVVNITKSATTPTTNTTRKTAISAAAKKNDNQPAEESKPLRGRPRKAPVAADPVKVNSNKVAAKTAAPATRTRTGSVNTSVQTKTTAAKKKVTFQDDESEKENRQAPMAKKTGLAKAERSELKQQPVKSQPTKKAAAKTNVSSTANTKEQGEELEAQKPRPEPLSPKKDRQVAKAYPIPDEEHDELLGSGTPLKQFQKSPVKDGLGSTGVLRNITSPIKTVLKARQDQASVDQDDELGISSHESNFTAALHGPTMSASPAKRPPPSPFKESMKSSPKKLASLPDTECQGEAARCPNDSLTSKSPMKFSLGSSIVIPNLEAASASELNASLFKSPARRPISPLKGIDVRSPTDLKHSRQVTSSVAKVGLSASPAKRSLLCLSKVSAPLKLGKSPETATRVYRMSQEEQNELFKNELLNGPDPFSPIKNLVTNPISEPKANVEKEYKLSPPPKTTESASELQSPSKNKRRSLARTRCTIPGTPAGRLSFEAQDLSPNVQSRADYNDFDDDSEDELQLSEQLYGKASQSQDYVLAFHEGSRTPNRDRASVFASRDEPSISMTVLAERFGEWKGASPDKSVLEERKTTRSVFSPLKNHKDASQSPSPIISPGVLQDNESFFDEALVIREDNDVNMTDAGPQLREEDLLRQSQISDASQEYGDENVPPTDPNLPSWSCEGKKSCTPARIFSDQPQVIHTVAKVPLKPSAEYEITPSTKPARRTHSLAATLSPQAMLELQALRQCNPSGAALTSAWTTQKSTPRKSKFEEVLDEKERGLSGLMLPTIDTPSQKMDSWSVSGTPARTPRANLNNKLLSGAVVYVDVYTTEGADASGLFVELLNQMGAKCVKQWNWNPDGSSVSDKDTGDLGLSSGPKVGITHVVFKDGGKRTMERVRDAKGLVMCVGVGWVLDCERENRWLDEAEYAIDTSTIPRGGHRRRKSMEPKALSNSLFGSRTPKRSFSAELLSPRKDIPTFSSPAYRRETKTLPVEGGGVSFTPSAEIFNTPVKDVGCEIFEDGDEDFLKTPHFPGLDTESTFCSPSTPYFLNPDKLLQQTCPPKQTQQLFFPVSGRIDDVTNEKLKRRLLVARRKSLQFAPKIGSPLSRP